MSTFSTRRLAAIPLVSLLVLALAALGGCAGGEAVTPQALRAARARWDRAGVRDYDLEWVSAGPRNASFAVRVRDGQVEKVETIAPDGQRYRVKPALPKYYSVEGLFLTIADDLAQLNQPAPFNHPKGARAVLRFTPDPKYGYPRRYRRDVMGATTALAIDVVRFTPAPGKGHDQPITN